MLKAQGCRFLFLTAYNPDLNTIKRAFSKWNALLRSIRARTSNHRINPNREIPDLFTPDK